MDVTCVALRHLMSPRSRMDTDDEEEEENVYMEAKRTTPQKCDQTSRKDLNADQVHITPSKLQDRACGDPLTPTANLKMLISAASPDIRDREMRKVLFRPIENESDDLAVDEHDEFDGADEGTDEFEKKPSRKQKSLGLLCKKFLALYPNYPASSKTISISLDEVATNLGVERRRIYDIVNVLESLKLVSRVAKNQYVWHGQRQLRHTLRELHGLGRKLRYHLQMEQPGECGPRAPSHADEPAPEHGDTGDVDASSGEDGVQYKNLLVCLTMAYYFSILMLLHFHSGPASGRKDKSLRIMSQKFVTLFLVSKTQTITLDLAAKILIEESQDMASHSKYKTKVRRLYDIANVLTSLNLIKKVHVREERGRKPAFKWTGPVDFHSTSGKWCSWFKRNGQIEMLRVYLDGMGMLPFPEFHADFGQSMSQPGCPRLTRHVSFNIVPVPVPVPAQRRVSSAPSSPHSSMMGLMPQAADYSGKTTDKPAECQQSGDESRLLTAKTGVLGSAATLPARVGLIHSDVLHESHPLPHLYPTSIQSPAPPREEEGTRTQAALTFFPTLPQSSLVMVYKGQEAHGAGAQGQRSPEFRQGVLGKRKAGDRDAGAAKRSNMVQREDQDPQERREGGRTEEVNSETDSSLNGAPCPALQPQVGAMPRVTADKETPLTTHYLYVPNSPAFFYSPGLNKLNLLLSSGHTAGGLPLSSSTLPAIAFPYVLLPPSALSSYPLITSGLPVSSGSFGIAGIVSPNHLVLGAQSLAVSATPDFTRSLSLEPLGPDQARVCGLASPVSPAGPQQPEDRSKSQLQPQTPLTPKEAGSGGSQTFFQTPGTLGSADPKVARKRGSAQRRLEIGPLPTN
ncbi:transcription factor E2F7-like [Scleropages formosus]|uniref:Transcription factor E2F7 n=1 Tax=Scleropages formosus TaxID=113540 RepID=A0A0P7V9N0_SCLFO|nr:transcription factor E2F7-like [Scleropages formosus]